MPNPKIIIPIVTEDELFDFPPRTASSADVFRWVKSRCYEAELDSERGPILSEVLAFTGGALHTKAIPQIMALLRTMGFTGNRKETGLGKARRIAGFVLAARRLIVCGLSRSTSFISRA